MTEFGHNSYAGKIGGYAVYVDGWGSGPFVMRCGLKEFRFEDSDRWGPHLVTKSGDICENPWPPERSPFWEAYKKWRTAGRPTAADGITCA